MNEQTITATQMSWKPRMVRLTSLNYPDLPSKAAFINPQHVEMIRVTRAEVKKDATDPHSESIWINCTLVHLGAQFYVHVLETPEQVARLCDAALGHSYNEGLKSV